MRVEKLSNGYTIECESVGNRKGFKHVGVLFSPEHKKLFQKSIQYSNKTWEAHQFDMLISNIIDKAVDKNLFTKEECGL